MQPPLVLANLQPLTGCASEIKEYRKLVFFQLSLHGMERFWLKINRPLGRKEECLRHQGFLKLFVDYYSTFNKKRFHVRFKTLGKSGRISCADRLCNSKSSDADAVTFGKLGFIEAMSSSTVGAHWMLVAGQMFWRITVLITRRYVFCLFTLFRLSKI